jgi:hypothetical protein
LISSGNFAESAFTAFGIVSVRKFLCRQFDIFIKGPAVAAALLHLLTLSFRRYGNRSGGPMAIYRLIASGHFGPDEIEVMTAAYEAALVDLG